MAHEHAEVLRHARRAMRVAIATIICCAALPTASAAQRTYQYRGDLVLATKADVDAALGMVGSDAAHVQVTGALVVSGNLADGDVAPLLKQVVSVRSLKVRNSALTSLDALSNLKHVQTSVLVVGNPKLASMCGLSVSRDAVGSFVSVYTNTALRAFPDGLDQGAGLRKIASADRCHNPASIAHRVGREAEAVPSVHANGNAARQPVRRDVVRRCNLGLALPSMQQDRHVPTLLHPGPAH